MPKPLIDSLLIIIMIFVIIAKFYFLKFSFFFFCKENYLYYITSFFFKFLLIKNISNEKYIWQERKLWEKRSIETHAHDKGKSSWPWYGSVNAEEYPSNRFPVDVHADKFYEKIQKYLFFLSSNIKN